MDKPLLSKKQLIQHMSEKGMTFCNMTHEEVEAYLTTNNYFFKLSSYRKNYNRNAVDETKYDKLDFSYLVELATIDMHLRHIIIRLSLDVEHCLKTRLLNNFENNPKEDGYKITSRYLSDEKNIHVLVELEARCRSSYCNGIINKYHPQYPAWALIEVLSFGDFIGFLKTYFTEYHINDDSLITLLHTVRKIRNAAAHNNCIINNLREGETTPHRIITQFIGSIDCITPSARSARLSNRAIYEFTVLLYVYAKYVNNSSMKQHRFSELKELFTVRMLRNEEYFAENRLICSSYDFITKVVDKVSDMN